MAEAAKFHTFRIPRWLTPIVLGIVVAIAGAAVTALVSAAKFYVDTQTADRFTSTEAMLMQGQIQAQIAALSEQTTAIKGLAETNQNLIIQGAIARGEIQQIIAGVITADENQDELIRLLLMWRDNVLSRNVE